MICDVVIPYRRSRSEELIYALRSLKNVPHGKVFIIGDNPRLNVNYISYHQGSDIAKNTLNILNLAVQTPEISDRFIWMADDMYFMRKVYRVPVLHRGTYDEILGKYGNRHNFYIQRMVKTNRMLKGMGVEKPLCYEVHAPFVINKRKWREISEHITPELNKLSMYGNLCKIGGMKTKDVKVRQKDWIPEGTFASSYDSTFATNGLGKIVRDLFPERSIYEK